MFSGDTCLRPQETKKCLQTKSWRSCQRAPAAESPPQWNSHCEVSSEGKQTGKLIAYSFIGLSQYSKKKTEGV